MDSDLNKNDPAPRDTVGFLKWTFASIVEKKKWWMLPFWALLVAIALVLFATGNGALLPAIYIAF